MFYSMVEVLEEGWNNLEEGWKKDFWKSGFIAREWDGSLLPTYSPNSTPFKCVRTTNIPVIPAYSNVLGLIPAYSNVIPTLIL